MSYASRSTKKRVDATTSGNGSGTQGGDITDGEGMGIAGGQRTVLNERSNKSLNRNSGDADVRPSANTGTVPTVGMGVRKTGRI